MTLIVYSNDVLYADDVTLVNPLQRSQRIARKQNKIFTNSIGVSIAVCGPFPKDVDKDYVFGRISDLTFYAETGCHSPYNQVFGDDETVARAELSIFEKKANLHETSVGSVTYLIGTRDGLYRLDASGFSVMRRHHEYAYGSGATYFAMCRKSGLSVVQSYIKVAEYEKTVGKLQNLSLLKELPNYVDIIIDDLKKQDSPMLGSTGRKLEAIRNYHLLNKSQ